MPPVATEVMKKAEDPDTNLPALAALISRDAALVVRVLKIANSSFYSMPRKITTVQQAIVLLGYSTLRSVVVAAAIKDVFARFGLAERLLWEHAVAAGVASSLIAQHVGGLARDEALVGGLLHDIGKLVMYAEAESKYQEVMKVVYADEADPVQAEIDVFGFDHTEVAKLLLTKWRLPERLTAAIAAHHHPEAVEDSDGAKPLAALLQVADQICLREGMGRRKPKPDLNPLECAGAEILGLVDADLDGLLTRFRAGYDEEREVFG
jgi:putative nucleotidyltransferase with HDIG domain